MTAPELRRGGSVRRVTVRRTATGRCIVCGAAWTGSDALAAVTRHGEECGHITEGSYTAEYVYVPTTAPGSTTPREDADRALRDRIVAFVTDNPGSGVRAIMAAVGGSNVRLRETLAALVASGNLVAVDGPNRTRRHYIAPRGPFCEVTP